MSKKLQKVKQLELNEGYNKVLHYFFSFPTMRIGLSDLASVVKISKTTANRIVTQLVDEEFLRVEEIGRVWQITCNQNHIYNYSKKISSNLDMVYISGILDTIHKQFPNPKAIILFGSYRKGDDTEESDLDIAVEIAGSEDLKVQELGIFPKFGYRESVTANLHIFSRKNIDLNLFANIANGIVLDGFLEVRP